MCRERTARRVSGGAHAGYNQQKSTEVATGPPALNDSSTNSAKSAEAQARKPFDAKFTRGSTMRHVVVMTMSGAIGLVAIFAVDLMSLVYISWLGNQSLTAGVGYATAVQFIMMSLNIGMMIATGALVSRAIGAGDKERARQLAGSAMIHATALSAVAAVAMMLAASEVLTLLGATGKPHAVAREFLMITLPSSVLMAAGMTLSAVLRAVGDA